MLSRKYYKMIAGTIKENTEEDKSGHNARLINKDNLVNDLCEYFKQDNNMFSRGRFEDACE